VTDARRAWFGIARSRYASFREVHASYVARLGIEVRAIPVQIRTAFEISCGSYHRLQSTVDNPVEGLVIMRESHFAKCTPRIRPDSGSRRTLFPLEVDALRSLATRGSKSTKESVGSPGGNSACHRVAPPLDTLMRFWIRPVPSGASRRTKADTPSLAGTTAATSRPSGWTSRVSEPGIEMRSEPFSTANAARALTVGPPRAQTRKAADR